MDKELQTEETKKREKYKKENHLSRCGIKVVDGVTVIGSLSIKVRIGKRTRGLD